MSRANRVGTRVRRGAVRLARWVLGLVASVLLVLVVALAALQLRWTRGAARGFLARTVSDAIPGRLSLGALDELSTNRIVARDVRLFDRRGREVLRIGRLVAYPRLAALTRGTLELASLRATGVRVRVSFDESGAVSLVDAVYESGADTEETDETGEEGGLDIVLRRIAIEGARVDVDLGHGEPLVLAGLRLRGDVFVREDTRVVLSRLDFDGARGGRPLLGTQRAHAAYADAPGAVSSVGVVLRGAPASNGVEDRIRLDARLRNPPSAEAELADSSVHARLALAPVTRRVLDVLGLADVARDAPPSVVAEFVLDGNFRDARLVGHVTSRDETLRLAAEYHAGRESSADLCSEGARLGSFWASLPDSRVGGCLHVTAGDFTEPDFPLGVVVRGATLDGDPLPDLALETTVHTGAAWLALESFDLPGLDGANRAAIGLEGRVGFDGTAHVVLTTDGFVLSDEPSLSAWFGAIGGVVRSRTTVDLEATGTADGPLRVRAASHVDVERLRTGEVRVARTRLDAEVVGSLDAPRARVHLVVDGLRSGDFVARSAALDARVSSDSADATFTARLPANRRVAMIAKASKRGARWTAGAHGTLGPARDPFHFEAERLDYVASSGALGIARLSIRHGASRAVLRGGIDGAGRLDLDVAIAEFDVADLLRAAGVRRSDLVGILEGQATIGGTTAIPTVDAVFELADAGALGIRDVSASLVLGYGTTAADLSLDVASPSAGAVALEASATWPRRMPPGRVAAGADVAARLAVQSLSVGALDRAQAVPLGVAGELDATLSARGPLAALTVALDATGTDLMAPGLSPAGGGLLATLRLRFDPDALAIELDAADDHGALASARLDAAISSRALFEGAPPLGEVHFRADVEVTERSVATLPVALGGLENYPLRLALRGGLENTPGKPLEAFATGVLQGTPVVGEPPRNGARASCGDVADLSVAFDAKLEHGETRMGLAMRDQGNSAAALTLVATTPVDAWLRGERDAAAFSADATGRIEHIEASSLPGVCAHARGAIEGTLTATRLGRPDAQASVHLEAPAMFFADDAPVRIVADASVAEGEALASLVLTGEGASGGCLGRGEVEARLPFTFGESGLSPTLPDGELRVRGRFDALSLEPFTAITPFVARRAGRLAGHVEVGGTMRAPAPRGEFWLADASLLMPGLDQRLSDLQAHVSLTPERIIIHEFRARDVRGRVALDGEATFSASTPTSLALEIHSRDFPARQAGITMAEVTSHARVRLVRERDALRGTLTFEELAVKMPDVSRGSVQSLEENPDVVYLDTPPEGWEPPPPSVREEARTADAPRIEADPADAAQDEGGGTVVSGADDMADDALRPTPVVVDDTPFVPTHFHIDMRRPFWIRRTDFGVQLTAELDVAVLETALQLSGEVHVVRGFLELLGNAFEMREGTIRFTGGSEIDPALDVLAVANPGRANEVRVRITGRLATMALRFSDANDREMTAGLAVQCITTGGCSEFGQLGGGGDDERAAADDARSALASMTVGLLTTAARHGIGDAVPRIAISSGDTLAEVTVRAGFEANRLIPHFLRHLVTSLYIEGFVSTDSDEDDREPVQSDNTRAVGGVLIELRHPRSFVTRGRYEPPNTWSLDVTWQR